PSAPAVAPRAGAGGCLRELLAHARAGGCRALGDVRLKAPEVLEFFRRTACTRFDFEKRLQALYRLVVTAAPKCRARHANFVFGAFSQEVGSSRGGARLGEPVTGLGHDLEVRL